VSGRGLLASIALLLAVVAGWRMRVWITHSNPAWERDSPVGLLKSDPALLYWFTERIAEDGGSIPDDFARTTSVQWPDEVDARVEFPQLQPWLAANLWRAFGGRTPLHEFCLSLFSFLAALTAVAAFGLALELTREPGAPTRRWGPAVVALALFFVLPANWRTTSFVLLGEDVAFPCLAFHLWLLARAARVRSAASFLLCGAFLAAAMAAWHATGFFVAIEAGALLAWTLRSGENPFAARRAWLALVPVAVVGALEPMMRGKLQLLSLPMALAYALLALAWIERRRRLAPLARTGVALGVVAATLGLGLLLARALGGGLGDYSHVFRLIAAKLANLGVKPRDPATLPFEVRILWQGPFDTLQGRALWLHLGTALLGGALLAALALPAWVRGRGDSRSAMLALAGAVALLATWLIQRTEILAGFLLAVASAVALVRTTDARGGGAKAAAALALLLPPAWIFFVGPPGKPSFVAYYRATPAWYHPRIVEEYRAAIDAVERLVPKDAPVAADEILSTAILAHARRPILVQPKYEWKAARARLEEFRTAATLGTPQQLADFLRSKRCRHLLFDWRTLWDTREQVGLADSVTAPRPDSAIAIAAAQPDRLPGFKLLWKSELPRDGLRLYELIER
jgi:hypothetical protein